MKTFIPQAIGLISLTIFLSNVAVAQQAPATPSQGANLAMVATASASFTSGDTSVSALNDGINPRSSRDARRGSWGNWPRRGTQWVQYEWSQPISTNRCDVYFWADGRGVHLPQSSRLLYFNGSDFVPVPNAKGEGTAGNQYNTTTFDEVTTTKLRLEMQADDPSSTGILEWKVYDSGKSPKFPPIVKAGIDRDVVVGGKTYLNATVKTLQSGSDEDSSAKITWSKDSGPGEVSFADVSSATTTATLSAPGEYVLKATAADGSLSSSSTLHVQVNPAAPAVALQPVLTRKYKIDSPLWSARLKSLIVNWIPHCYTEISDPNLKEGGIENFVQAANKLAGRPFKPHVGYPFSNAWVYNTIEAMSVALMVDPQADQQIIDAQNAMRAKLNEWIPIILAAQEPDGYLQTRFTLGTARDQSPPQRWSPRYRGEHEGYTAGYFIEAAIAHHIMTGGTDDRLYNAAKKLADCWYDNIGPSPKKPWFDGHQEMEQALVRLGNYVNQIEGSGKGDKYIELAKFLLDCRRDGSEYDQSHLPVVQQYEAVGHAVRAAYMYSGMAAVAIDTHDTDYQSAIQSLWDNIVNRKLYVTGGIGSGETSEGFGPDYSLRNNSYCESCSNCGELFFQHKMHLLQHDAKYVDLYEDTLYNAILGDTDLEGKNFYYQNPLDSRRERYAWHDCPCCVGNIPRVLLSLPTWMYSTGADSLYVNLFIGSTVDVENVAGTNVQMVQQTDYPWNGKVTITVNPQESKQFKIRIRTPDRDVSDLYTNTPQANGIMSIAVNGATIASPTIENGYAVIDRTWQAGDKIEFELPMKVQRIKASDKIAADQGRVALRYGPLIYNIESVDQPNIDSAVLPDSSSLTTQWKPDLLDGVVVIKGTFADGSPMLAIPNYARSNRGGHSIVWMKDQ